MRQLLVPDLGLSTMNDVTGASDLPAIALSREMDQRLRRVLRMRDGTRLTVCDGAGRRASAELAPDGLRLLQIEAQTTPRRPEIWLAFAPLKGDRGDWLVEKAVEIGADVLIPLRCDHAVAKLDPGRAERQLDRWQALADAALEQCGRPWRARVGAPTNVNGLAAATAAAGVACTWLVADERGGQHFESAAGAAMLQSSAAPQIPTAVGVVIGPEGGLSADERSSLAEQGVVAITLGDDVLRAETAALVALARLATLRQNNS